MYHTRRARAVPALLHCSASLHYTQRITLFIFCCKLEGRPRQRRLRERVVQRRLRERVVPVVPQSKATDACADSQMDR